MKSMVTGLIRETLTAPAAATARLISYDFPRRALWMAVVLVIVLASLLSASALILLPLENPDIAKLVQSTMAYQSPMTFTFFQVLQTGFGIYAVWFLGRSLGGVGRLEDVLAAICLVQAAAMVVVIGVMMIGMLIPGVSAVGLFIILIWSIWASVSAVTVAHQFASPLKAFGALFGASVATVFVSLMVLSVLMPVAQPGGL